MQHRVHPPVAAPGSDGAWSGALALGRGGGPRSRSVEAGEAALGEATAIADLDQQRPRSDRRYRNSPPKVEAVALISRASSQVASRSRASRPVVGMAARLGGHRGAVSAELRHNGGRCGYCAAAAQDRADRQRSRPNVSALVAVPELNRAVATDNIALADRRVRRRRHESATGVSRSSRRTSSLFTSPAEAQYHRA